MLHGESTPFVMELLPYRLPTMRGLIIHTWERTWQYIKKAGTVILGISILLWALMTYPGLPENRMQDYAAQRQALQSTVATQDLTDEINNQLMAIDAAEAMEGLRNSFAGRIGTALENISRYAGIDWRTNIALVGGVAAKEVIVSTLGTAYSLGEVDPEDSGSLSKRLATDPKWNPVVALAVLVFIMFYSPCFVQVT